MLVARAGYLPVALKGDDYLELLPATWRAINDYGIQLDYRTYDTPELDPYRRQRSGVDAKRGLWEVHYDPYDLSTIWIRDRYQGGWITVPWTHLPMVRQPFADFTWRYARRLTLARGADDTDQTTIATVLAELLRRAEAGPSDRRIVERTQAAAALPLRPAPPQPSDHDPDDQAATEEEVVPFGVFDPLAEDGYPL